MTQEYGGRPGWYGRLYYSADTVRRFLSEALTGRDQLMLHVMGDATGALVLRLMQELAPDSTWRDKRVRFEHANGIAGPNIAQARRFGIVASQPRVDAARIAAWKTAGIPVALSLMRILGRSRLILVGRLVGLLLAHSLVVSSAMASSMHVHQYAEHDHPEHHHGPASHEHEHSALAEQDHHPATDDDHPAFQAESCDPGRHAVATTLGCAQVPQSHVDLGELPGPTIIAPAAPIRSATPVVDVRVHGPPFDARIPARAPPLTPHA